MKYDKEIPEFLTMFRPQPLNEMAGKTYMAMLMGFSFDEEADPAMKDFLLEQPDYFIGQLLQKRVEGYALPFELSAGFVLSADAAAISGAPGNAMIILRICYEWQKKHPDVKKITVYQFADIFPDGCPSPDSMEKMWNAQKCAEAPLGNMLDDPEMWPTDAPKEEPVEKTKEE